MIGETEFLDFVYIGAPRCASTWLAAIFDEHQDIFIPHNKEIHFFNDRLLYPFEYKYLHGIKYYRRYFEDAPPKSKIGELSPFYYLDPNTAYRIYISFPNVKIIIGIRNPVDLIHSLYLLLRSRERRAKTFEEELIRKPQIMDIGFFHRLLTPYFDWFPRENIFIFEYEKFFQDEHKACQQIFKFIEVDATYKPSVLGIRINAAPREKPKFRKQLRGLLISSLNTSALIPLKNAMHKLKINKMNYDGTYKLNAKKNTKPKLSLETRRKLLTQLEPDISRLEKMLTLNLGYWRKIPD